MAELEYEAASGKNSELHDLHNRIQVGIIDPNVLECEGLEALITASSQFTCAGAWHEPLQALQSIAQVTPDIVLVDIQLCGNRRFEFLQELRSLSPRSAVIYLVDCAEGHCAAANGAHYWKAMPQAVGGPLRLAPTPQEDCRQTALKYGARAVVRRQCSFHHLAHVMSLVAAGQLWMESNTAELLAQQFLTLLHSGQPESARGDRKLTARQWQVVELIGRGLSNKEIAARLGLAYPTVKNCVSTILKELELGDRTHIALYAVGKENSAEGTAA